MVSIDDHAIQGSNNIIICSIYKPAQSMLNIIQRLAGTKIYLLLNFVDSNNNFY